MDIQKIIKLCFTLSPILSPAFLKPQLSNSPSLNFCSLWSRSAALSECHRHRSRSTLVTCRHYCCKLKEREELSLKEKLIWSKIFRSNFIIKSFKVCSLRMVCAFRNSQKVASPGLGGAALFPVLGDSNMDRFSVCEFSWWPLSKLIYPVAFFILFYFIT